MAYNDSKYDRIFFFANMRLPDVVKNTPRNPGIHIPLLAEPEELRSSPAILGLAGSAFEALDTPSTLGHGENPDVRNAETLRRSSLLPPLPVSPVALGHPRDGNGPPVDLDEKVDLLASLGTGGDSETEVPVGDQGLALVLAV